MQRIVKVLTVAVLVATVLVITSTVAFARPLRGGLPLMQPESSKSFVCERLVGNNPRFVPKALDPPPPEVEATCWHTSPGLRQASNVVPLE